MKRVFVIAVLVLAGTAFASETNEYIIKAPDAEALETFVAEHGLTIKPLINYPNPSEEVLALTKDLFVIPLPELVQENRESLLADLANLNGIEEVYPNRTARIPDVECESRILNMPDTSLNDPYTPNDPLFPQQWDKPKIQAEYPWGAGITGEGVVIFIMDTGVKKVADLEDNILDEGWDFYNDNANVFDDVNGHGTKVAGTAAAKGDNEVGVAGTAYDASIISLQIVRNDNETIDGASEIEALYYVADYVSEHPEQKVVVNMSFGFKEAYEPEQTAINTLNGKGVVMFAATGNDTRSYFGYTYPASCENVIPVGASTSNDSRRSTSNWGDDVLYAPGDHVLTTDLTGYDTYSGTSIGSPNAAGVAVLMLQTNPYLTPDDVEEVLYQTADDITTDKGPAKRVNAKKAIEEALDRLPIAIAEQPIAAPRITATEIQHGQVNFAYSIPAATPYTLSIYNVSGRKVADQNGQLADSGEITYNPVSLSEGVYFWRISTEQDEVSGKFVYVK